MAIAETGSIVTSVTVPFDSHPPVFSCARFGAPVSKGERLEARLASGESIYL